MSTLSEAELQRLLTAEVDRYASCRSASVAISETGGRIAATVAGVDHLGQRLDLSALFSLYCCAKVCVAVSAMHLVDAGEVSLSDRVGHILPGFESWIGDIELSNLLTNSAGLHEHHWMISRVLPEEHRGEWVAAAQPVAGFRVGESVAYAPYAPWHILGLVLERVTGSSFDEFAQRVVIAPLGIDLDDLTLRINPGARASLLPRVAASWPPLGTGSSDLPLLAEAGFETAGEWNPAFGGYGTTTALARLVSAILKDAEGGGAVLSTESASRMIETQLAGNDSALGRRVAYGLGTLTELGRFGFPEMPVDAFGSTAEGGLVGWMGSKHLGAAIAWRFDTMMTEPVESDKRRRRVIEPIVMALSA